MCYYQRHKPISQPEILVDVAHNPHAAKSLAHNLQTTPCTGRTLAVFAMLADKDIEGVVNELAPYMDAWYLADIHSARGAKAADLQSFLVKQVNKSAINLFADVGAAIDSAYKNAAKNDRIIVFGSFYTVADAIASQFNRLHGAKVD
jgi:dihydrofolate synthase / folylpolyglutamate synthase